MLKYDFVIGFFVGDSSDVKIHLLFMPLKAVYLQNLSHTQMHTSVFVLFSFKILKNRKLAHRNNYFSIRKRIME